MSFEQMFDYWLACKVNELIVQGYDSEQVKVWMNMLYSDFLDIIDNDLILLDIKKKIQRTVEIFLMEAKNEQTA